MEGPDDVIIFHKSKTIHLDKPHNDALVIKLVVTGFKLSRLMIDIGSSLDVLCYDAFRQWD